MNIQKLWQLRPLFCPFYFYSRLPVLFLQPPARFIFAPPPRHRRAQG
jgi:hypothetical protein